MNKKRSRLFEELILKSWWTIVFFLITLFAFDQASARRSREEILLRDKVASLTQKKHKAIELQDELEQIIASQNDPAWIELVLMKELGLVPEGNTKILIITPQATGRQPTLSENY